ncbi:hypothetical protein ACFQ07_09335, partial [Actinomadura adrarensis]
LPTGERLAALHDELRTLGEALAGYGDYVEDLDRVDAFGEEALARLTEECGRAAHFLESLQEGWLVRLREQVAQDRQWLNLWSGHAQKLREYAHKCGELRGTLSGASIELPGGFSRGETLELLRQLRERFESRKKVSPVLQRNLSQFWKATWIDGEQPRTAEDVDKVIAFVELRRLREASYRLWMDEMVVALGAPPAP